MTNLLDDLKTLPVRAFYATSHVPEQAAYIREYVMWVSSYWTGGQIFPIIPLFPVEFRRIM